LLIKNLKIKNFRNLVMLNLDLGPGITLIKANNEGGKTSIRQALNYAFYVDPKSTSSSIREVARWGHGGMYEIAVEFSVGGEEYRLVKDFEAKTAVLENKSTGRKVTAKNAIAESLAELLGLPTANLMKNTVYFSAEELSGVKNTEDLRRRLEDKLTGVEGVSVADLMKKIDKAISDLQKGLNRPAKEPGPIKEYWDKLQELKDNLTEIQEEVENTSRYQARLTDLDAEVEDINNQLELKTRENEKYADYKKLKEQLDQAQKDFDSFDQQLKLLKELSEEKEKLTKNEQSLKKKLDNYKQALEAVNQTLEAYEEADAAEKLSQELKEKTGKINEAGKLLEQAVEEREKCVYVEPDDLQKSKKLANEIQALSLAGKEQGFKIELKPLADIKPEIQVDGQLQTWDPGTPIEARAGAVITIPGVAKFIVSNRNTKAASNLEMERKLSKELDALLAKYSVREYDELEKLKDKWTDADQNVKKHENVMETLLGGKTVEHYQSKLNESEKKVLEARKKVETALSKARDSIALVEPDQDLTDDIRGFLTSKKEEYNSKHKDFESQHSTVNNRLQQIIGKLETLPPQDELEKGKKEAATKLYVAQTAFENLNLPEITAEQIVKLEKDIERLKKAYEAKNKEKTHLEALVRVSKHGIEDIFEIEGAIQHYQNLYETAVQRVEVLKKVRELFDEARKNTLTQIAASIGSQVTEYFRELTGGRYPHVEINPDGLEITVYSDEKGDRLDIDGEMSTGTRDQLYMSVRLAMIPAVAGGKKPPIIMDDALVYFDPERREKAFKILRKLAEEHQVIIFSCHSYYDKIADTIVELKTSTVLGYDNDITDATS